MNGRYQVVLELYNNTNQPRRIWIEPWGEGLSLPPCVAWRLVCDGEERKPIPIEFHEDSIAIHGLPKSMVRIYCDKELIWECFQPFDPPVA
jgi:hypothetical protein